MTELWQRLRTWLAALAPRERQLVLWGGLAAAILLFLGGLVLPLYAAAARAEQRVTQKQEDLTWMRSVAPELGAAGPANGSASGDSLVVVIDQTARAIGLGAALGGVQPSGTGGARVRLDNASFDTLIAWFSQLEQQHGLTVESATIDRSAQPGAVNVSVIFKKAG